jgi:hypothetical protein
MLPGGGNLTPVVKSISVRPHHLELVRLAAKLFGAPSYPQPRDEPMAGTHAPHPGERPRRRRSDARYFQFSLPPLDQLALSKSAVRPVLIDLAESLRVGQPRLSLPQLGGYRR